jgi:hypothetical protein
VKIIHPKNYLELIEACKAANCLSWFGDSKTLTLLTDDKPNDRRTAITFRMTGWHDGKQNGVCEVRTVCGFDPIKNYWGGGYVAPQGTINFPNKRGQKAFLAWLHDAAIKQCEWQPNPMAMHIDRKEQNEGRI